MKQSLGAKTLIMPAPVWVVGSYDKEGKPNLMTAAWGGICCSKPPCVTVSLRKATYTYGNLIKRGAYTLSVPSQDQAPIADYLGMASGRKTDKFAGAGLTPVKSDLVDAPYAAEFSLVLECKLIHTLEVGLHTMFIGEIADVKVDSTVVDGDGMPDITKVRPLIYAPERHDYHGVGPIVGKAFSAGKKLL